MIIIIHPGSQNLRIGRASDLNPYCMLHAIARRRTPGGLSYRDPVLPPTIDKVSFCFWFFNLKMMKSEVYGLGLKGDRGSSLESSQE